MATPQEVLDAILARLKTQPVAPQGVPTTTTPAPALPDPTNGMDLQTLAAQQMLNYQQGKKNVNDIYGATTANFMGPGQDILLKLIESLMAAGFTMEQIQADPNVMSYISSLNQLMGTMSQNQATDTSWFDKLGALNTTALSTAAAFPAVGGGGGGGGGGRRGGGGYRRYGGGGYGGGGGGDGELKDMKTDRTLQEKAITKTVEYNPDFTDEIDAIGRTPEEQAFLARLRAQYNNDPRTVGREVAEDLNTMDLNMETEEALINAAKEAIAREEASNAEEQAVQDAARRGFVERANAEYGGYRSDFYRNLAAQASGLERRAATESDQPSSGTYGDILPDLNNPGAAVPTPPRINPTANAPYGTDPRLTNINEFVANPINPELTRRQFVDKFVSDNNKNLPWVRQAKLAMDRRYRSGEDGDVQVVPPSDEGGRNYMELVADMLFGRRQQELLQEVFDTAQRRDPNVQPNETQRSVTTTGTEQSKQTGYGDEYFIGETDGFDWEPVDGEVENVIQPSTFMSRGKRKAFVNTYDRDPAIYMDPRARTTQKGNVLSAKPAIQRAAANRVKQKSKGSSLNRVTSRSYRPTTTRVTSRGTSSLSNAARRRAAKLRLKR